MWPAFPSPTYSRRCAAPGTAGDTRTPARHPQPDRGTAPGLRVDVELGPHLASAPAHARQALPLRVYTRVEPGAVVRHPEREPWSFDGQLDLDTRAAGVARGVVDRLLEHEEEVAPHLDVDPQRPVRFRGRKVDGDALRGKHL